MVPLTILLDTRRLLMVKCKETNFYLEYNIFVPISILYSFS